MIPEVAGAVVAGAGALRGDDRPAHRAVVLHVAVDVVRHLVVDADVVHLPDRQLHTPVAPAMLRGNGDAGVVGDGEAIGVLRIPPDVVVVAAPVDAAERLAAVDRLKERAVGDQDLVRIGRRDREVNVVAGASDQLARPVHDAPVRAAILAPPHHGGRGVDDVLVLGIDRDGREIAAADARERPPINLRLSGAAGSGHDRLPVFAGIRGLVEADDARGGACAATACVRHVTGRGRIEHARVARRDGDVCLDDVFG